MTPEAIGQILGLSYALGAMCALPETPEVKRVREVIEEEIRRIKSKK